MGVIKRQACVPAKALHEKFSKATLHEALLDLWMEHEGLTSTHPGDLTDEQWAKFHEMVAFRSDARRRQGL
jgi:hypothetical protein